MVSRCRSEVLLSGYGRVDLPEIVSKFEPKTWPVEFHTDEHVLAARPVPATGHVRVQEGHVQRVDRSQYFMEIPTDSLGILLYYFHPIVRVHDEDHRRVQDARRMWGLPMAHHADRRRNHGIGVSYDREFYSHVGQLLGGRDPLLYRRLRVHG